MLSYFRVCIDVQTIFGTMQESSSDRQLVGMTDLGAFGLFYCCSQCKDLETGLKRKAS